MNKILVFTPGGETTLCFDVFINDDRIYERLEMFSLSLNPLESAHIPLANSTVFVQILDNEGTAKIISTLFASSIHFSLVTCIYNYIESRTRGTNHPWASACMLRHTYLITCLHCVNIQNLVPKTLCFNC